MNILHSRRVIFGLIALLFCTQFSFAQSSKATVQELFKVSGIEGQFESVDQLVENQLQQSKATMSPEEHAKLEKILKSSLNAELLTNSFEEYYLKNCSEEKLKAVIKLYDNPLVEKAKQGEIASKDPAKESEMMTFFQNMGTNPPSQERIMLIGALNEELGTTEMTASLMKSMMSAIFKGANSMAPENEKLTDEQMKAQANQAFPPMVMQQLQQQMIAYSFYMYKDLSDEELKEYTKVWASEDGKYFTGNTIKALSYSFEKVGESMGKSIVK
ncbi:hypothetical protein KMW28_01830 [Flammeovirga yaeyamensis]|uniref:DUF2059 domain-containing protein n=1 Tax=Flammeovirga yaeyamensis TaxID=367791 RepID=A0AAX1N463_9BACT|nr:hypothetical protein [Flammeovirga yaeyamensis]MBB3699827.1 succinate dehydrogenase flavin-adding protein (antitoxin of CptAB toxin-antitoxin module) [Flammeovirga yaeyamensis]NMF36604.1 hypothetical protein [Flammeovirga yaeyamensis]QWG02349.1 hypothetical protein KMW28_01830 [Flammeovirga yaeyamensis]